MIRKWQSWVVLEYAVIALVYIITYYDKHIIHWIIAHFTLRNKDKGKENNVVLPWEASRSPCTLKSYLQCGMTVSTDAISVLLTEEHYTGSREEEKGKEGEITEHTVFFVAFGHASINMVRIFCRKRNFSKLAYSSCKYRRLASLEKSVIFFFSLKRHCIRRSRKPQRRLGLQSKNQWIAQKQELSILLYVDRKR